MLLNFLIIFLLFTLKKLKKIVLLQIDKSSWSISVYCYMTGENPVYCFAQFILLNLNVYLKPFRCILDVKQLKLVSRS